VNVLRVQANNRKHACENGQPWLAQEWLIRTTQKKNSVRMVHLGSTFLNMKSCKHDLNCYAFYDHVQ
jgi:hypothetical protein